MNPYKSIVAFSFCSVFAAISQGATLSENFDKTRVDSDLVGWSHGFYGTKGNPKWLVSKDSTAPLKIHVSRMYLSDEGLSSSGVDAVALAIAVHADNQRCCHSHEPDTCKQHRNQQAAGSIAIDEIRLRP